MNIPSFLFRKITLLHIEMGQDGIVRRKSAAVHFSKGKAVMGSWADFDMATLSKWKNAPALVLITGENIISRAYDKQDAGNKRIMNDAGFLWDLNVADGGGETLSFLRREQLAEFLQAIGQQHLVLIDTWIYGSDTEYSIPSRLEKLYADRFKSSALMKSSDFKNTLANALFQKLFLPVLLLFFGLLLGNYFLNSYYTKQYQEKQNIIQQNKRESRASSAEEQKKNQLLAGYTQIPDQSFALLADRIASYVPVGMFLTAMDIFPLSRKTNPANKKVLPLDFHVIRIKGTVEVPGSITLLSQLLEADSLFEKVKVVQLERIKNEDVFEFELEITL